MKIVIVGCGYIGEAAAKNWKRLGHTITATTRDPAKRKHFKTFADHVVILRGSFKEALEGQEALLLSVAPNKTEDYFDTYVNTSKAILFSVPPSLGHILYTSSTSVYGDHQGNWVDESTPLIPTNPLIETERLLQTFHRKICILRLGEIYGPGREIAKRLKSSHVFPGTGENYTNLSHRDMIVEGLNFALENGLEGIYNLCEDFHVPRKELYAEICKKHSLPLPKWDSTLPSRHSGNRRVSSKKIHDLGFKRYGQKVAVFD